MESGQDQEIALQDPKQIVPDELERILTGQTLDFEINPSPVIGGSRPHSNDGTGGRLRSKKLKKYTWQ